MTSRFLTTGDHQRIRSQCDDGILVRVIAENLGLSERTIYRSLKERPTTYRRPEMCDRGIEPETIREAERLVQEDGLTMKEAAIKVGIDPKTLTSSTTVRPTPEQATASRARIQRAAWQARRAQGGE